MKTLSKIVTIVTTMAISFTQIQAQQCGTPACCEPTPCCDNTVCCDDGQAYCDSGCASYWSAAIPIGAIVVAAVIIAATSNSHHHSSSSSSKNNSYGKFDPSRSRSRSSSSISHN